MALICPPTNYTTIQLVGMEIEKLGKQDHFDSKL